MRHTSEAFSSSSQASSIPCAAISQARAARSVLCMHTPLADFIIETKVCEAISRLFPIHISTLVAGMMGRKGTPEGRAAHTE